MHSMQKSEGKKASAVPNISSSNNDTKHALTGLTAVQVHVRKIARVIFHSSCTQGTVHLGRGSYRNVTCTDKRHHLNKWFGW